MIHVCLIQGETKVPLPSGAGLHPGGAGLHPGGAGLHPGGAGLHPGEAAAAAGIGGYVQRCVRFFYSKYGNDRKYSHPVLLLYSGKKM